MQGATPTDPDVRHARLRFFSNQSLFPLWRITVLPCKRDQMLWTILGRGKGSTRRRFWNVSQPIPLGLLRRLSP